MVRCVPSLPGNSFKDNLRRLNVSVWVGVPSVKDRRWPALVVIRYVGETVIAFARVSIDSLLVV